MPNRFSVKRFAMIGHRGNHDFHSQWIEPDGHE